MYCQSQKLVRDNEIVESEELNAVFSLLCICFAVMLPTVILVITVFFRLD